MRELKAVELISSQYSDEGCATIRPVNVVTDLHQEPSLPATVTVEYDKGFLKPTKSLRQAIPKEKLDHYQTFEVLGKVEGLDLEAAKVSVEGIVSVEEVRDNSNCRSTTITRKCS